MRVKIRRLKSLSLLNMLGIRALNDLPIICFNKPRAFWNGTETLSYSYNLNMSYHPRLPCGKDVKRMQDNSIVIVGEQDEVMHPEKFSDVFPHTPTHIVPGAKHLDIVTNPHVFGLINDWLDDEGAQRRPANKEHGAVGEN